MHSLVENMISDDDIEDLVNLLRSREQLTMSKNVENFEKEFAKHVKAPYAVMVNSGSSANLLAFAALVNPMFEYIDLDYKYEILVPSIAWSTSIAPIIQFGLKPVFVDIDSSTFQINIEDMKNKYTDKTRAILLVHILGNGPNMNDVMEFCNSKNLIIIEDTCEALGTTYKDKYLGTFGLFGTYSFYFSHHITTIEGGMIICRNKKDYNLLKCMRAHGWIRHLDDKKEYEEKHVDIDSRFLFINTGFNLRPMEINGLLGLSQLKKLETFNNVRKENFVLFKKMLEKDNRNDKMYIIDSSENINAAWFCIPITLHDIYSDRMSNFKIFLDKKGIENRPIVSGNFSKQPMLKLYGLNLNSEEYPQAEKIHNNSFYIGLSAINKYTEKYVGTILDVLFSKEFW